jgi:hypothetical protein
MSEAKGTHILDGVTVKEVSVDFSFTKNLGNYQSCKMQAGVTFAIPEGKSPEDIEEMTKKAEAFCMKRVAEISANAGSRL